MSNKYYRDWERSQSSKSNSYSNMSPQTYLNQVQNHIINQMELEQAGSRSNSIFALSDINRGNNSSVSISNGMGIGVGVGVPVIINGVPMIINNPPTNVQYGPQIIFFR